MQHGVAISLACTAFSISEACYWYQSKRRVGSRDFELADPTDR